MFLLISFYLKTKTHPILWVPNFHYYTVNATDYIANTVSLNKTKQKIRRLKAFKTITLKSSLICLTKTPLNRSYER